MDRAGDELLSAAALAFDQHGKRRRARAFNRFARVDHQRAVAQQLARRQRVGLPPAGERRGHDRRRGGRGHRCDRRYPFGVRSAADDPPDRERADRPAAVPDGHRRFDSIVEMMRRDENVRVDGALSRDGLETRTTRRQPREHAFLDAEESNRGGMKLTLNLVAHKTERRRFVGRALTRAHDLDRIVHRRGRRAGPSCSPGGLRHEQRERVESGGGDVAGDKGRRVGIGCEQVAEHVAAALHDARQCRSRQPPQRSEGSRGLVERTGSPQLFAEKQAGAQVSQRIPRAARRRSARVDIFPQRVEVAGGEMRECRAAGSFADEGGPACRLRAFHRGRTESDRVRDIVLREGEARARDVCANAAPVVQFGVQQQPERVSRVGVLPAPESAAGKRERNGRKRPAIVGMRGHCVRRRQHGLRFVEAAEIDQGRSRQRRGPDEQAVTGGLSTRFACGIDHRLGIARPPAFQKRRRQCQRTFSRAGPLGAACQAANRLPQIAFAGRVAPLLEMADATVDLLAKRQHFCGNRPRDGRRLACCAVHRRSFGCPRDNWHAGPPSFDSNAWNRRQPQARNAARVVDRRLNQDVGPDRTQREVGQHAQPCCPLVIDQKDRASFDDGRKRRTQKIDREWNESLQARAAREARQQRGLA